jgi:1-phosphofructokinase family hexose kinase
MILTINANAAVDIVMFIERFIPGETMRPTRVVPSVGGKGLDTAVVLQALGAPHKAVSFAAGRNGETLERLLKDRHIDADLIWLEGETRVANVIVETEFNRHSHITTPGYSVTAQDCAVFKERIQQYAAQASWAVIAGSLPGGAPTTLYAEITHLLHQAGCKVLIDCFGQVARDTLPALPDIVKMNREEFCMTFHARPQKQADWVSAVRQEMQRHRIQNFVLTCGKDGILAFTPEAVYRATTPRMLEVNAAGSGDAVSGTIPYRLSLGESWEQALRWSAAAGAAVVLTEGTAECRLADVINIYSQTTVENMGLF